MSEEAATEFNIEDHGRWEGTRFVFDPPLWVRLRQGQRVQVESVDREHMVLTDGPNSPVPVSTPELFIQKLIESQDRPDEVS